MTRLRSFNLCMKNLFAILALATSFASQIVCATGTVEGVITDAAGSPVRGASVHFDRVDKNNRYSLKTDKSGHYAHYGLAPGRYRISAFAPDGEPIEQKEAVVSTESIVRMDFVATKFSN
jgi:2',3'-cyclic-nucleotide 2'-phosphodiesterase (5'-nucleotidase family)